MRIVITVPVKDESAAQIDSCYDHIGRSVREFRKVLRYPAILIVSCHDSEDSFLGFSGKPPLGVDGIEAQVRPGVSIGAARNLGLEYEPDVLLSTDADSYVPLDWITKHYERIRAGCAASIGSVELHTQAPKAKSFLRALDPIKDQAVFEQNMAFDAKKFARVGGFPDLSEREGPGALRRLKEAGYFVAHAYQPVVITSDRVSHRVKNGLSSMIQQLLRRLSEGTY